MPILICYDGSPSAQQALTVAAGLLGSVSNALVHHAHRPVLLVPTPNARASQ
jgi:hypothetical protein